MVRRSGTDSGDRLLGLALLLGAVAYLAVLPRPLGRADEAFFLYHAKRILEGQVVFRDFHELYMPLAHYGMALLFALFGVGRATATLGTAVLHGITAWLVFRAARGLAVGRPLAALAGLAYIAVCQPAWPFASPHWLGSLFLVAVLGALLARESGDPRRRHWALGAWLGLLFCTQHQNGAPAALGVAAVVALDAALDRRFGAAAGALSAAGKLGRVVAGAVAVVAPFLIGHVVVAGPGPVLAQLFVHPFTMYRAAVPGAAWGSGLPPSDVLLPYTFPVFLAWLPALLPLGLARGLRALRAGDRAAVARQIALVGYGAVVVASISYHPDFIHIAFVAPVFLVLLAEALEAGLGALAAHSGRPRAVAALGLAVALAGGAGLCIHLAANERRLRAWFPHAADTAFGTVHLERPSEAALVRGIRRRLEGEASRELLAYPLYISLYLLADADNPSRYDYCLPGYLTPAMLEEVRDTVVARELRYVVLAGAFLEEDDPVVRHVESHYRCVGLDRGRCVLYERAGPGS